MFHSLTGRSLHSHTNGIPVGIIIISLVIVAGPA
jgi:hypothetical protein